MERVIVPNYDYYYDNRYKGVTMEFFSYNLWVPSNTNIPIDYSKEYVPLFGYSPIPSIYLGSISANTLILKIKDYISIPKIYIEWFTKNFSDIDCKYLSCYIKNKQAYHNLAPYQIFKESLKDFITNYLITPHPFLAISETTISDYSTTLPDYFLSNFPHRIWLSRVYMNVICGGGMLADYTNSLLSPLVCLVVKKEALPWIRYKLLINEEINSNEDGIFKLYVQKYFDHKDTAYPLLRKVYRKHIIPWAKDLNIPIEKINNLKSELFILPEIPKFETMIHREMWINNLSNKVLYSENVAVV